VRKKQPHIDTSITIASRTDLLGAAREFVAKAARSFGFQDEQIDRIELAVDEACTNIIKHAYKFDSTKNIVLTITSDYNTTPPRLVIRIFDDGITFDSAHYSAPDLKEYFMRMQKGGLGIVLMRKMMDEVEYAITPDNRNSITLAKYLQQAGHAI
jgi:serine/threonine-protein kinase RsbW